MCFGHGRIDAKGHLISKGNFVVFNSQKKTDLKMLIFALAYFPISICFLGELKKTKSPFEINWPLDSRDTCTLRFLLYVMMGTVLGAILKLVG